MLEDLGKYQRYLRRYVAELTEHVVKEYGWLSETPRLFTQLIDTTMNIQDIKTFDEGDGTPTIVVPGFGVSNGSTLFLRRILSERGHVMLPWEVSANHGFNENDMNTTIDQVKRVSDEFGTPVNLIGQSLGGCYIRTVANDIPDHVSKVITLGTPINGIEKIEANTREKYDRTVGFVDACFIHHGEFLDTFINNNPDIPTTSIFSETDGVVHWTLSEIEETETSENIKINNASHFSMAFSIETLRIVANRLHQHPEAWYKWSQHEKIVKYRDT